MVIDHSDVGTRCLIGDVMKWKKQLFWKEDNKWYVHPILGIGISIVITIIVISLYALLTS